MLRFSKKIIVYGLMLTLVSLSLAGCNNADSDQKDDATKTEADGQVSDDQALNNAIAEALDNSGNDDANNAEQASTDGGDGIEPTVSGATAEPVNRPIAERSPIEIIRIEVPVEEDSVNEPVNGEPEKIEHEVTPNLFPVDKCQVEVNGIYQVKLAKDLLKEINTRRADRKLGALTENTGLQACADSRCKEQTYFIGHFRPDGSAFDSVGRGYVQGECIAIDYRSVNDIMEAWFSVNESRYQIMNPDYTQCGISIYDIDGIYYIAAEFGY